MKFTHAERESAWEYIEANVATIPDAGCWVWVTQNYNGFIHFRGKPIRFDQLAYETLKGAIPDGHSVIHKCRVSSCVNPEHMGLTLDQSTKIKTISSDPVFNRYEQG